MQPNLLGLPCHLSLGKPRLNVVHQWSPLLSPEPLKPLQMRRREKW
jgi:hypothetical protein